MKQGSILNTKILVKSIAEEEKRSPSGIIIPGGMGKAPNISGVVVQVGEGLGDKVPMVVSVGQTAMYYPNSAQKLIIDGDEFSLIDVRDVLFYF